MGRIWNKFTPLDTKSSNGAGKINPHTKVFGVGVNTPLKPRRRNEVSLRGRPKVFVAMSGGVDSSVAAALLKKATPNNFKKLFGRPTPKGFRGYRVIGVFFKPWTPKYYDIGCRNICSWQKDRQDAMAVASVLKIPFKTWDFSKVYGRKVGNYMIDSYRRGLTPNPDVMCNKEIKFGLFLKKALTEGADYIATGHYVRKKQTTDNKQPITESRRSEKSLVVGSKLLVGIDKNKDQSYFLWTLNQGQLKRCLFPIGNHTKPEVRKLAKKFGLPVYDKKDSQGVCFIGQLDMKDFLKKHIKPKNGEIRLLNSRSNLKKFQGSTLVGYHDGAAYYTIGQRHGLNITDGGGPYFVAGKNLKRNIIFVAKEENLLLSREINVKNMSWVNGKKLPKKFSVKIRYRTEGVPAVLIKQKNGKLRFKTAKPVRAVTPGQSVVFYRGQEILGGGVIS